MTVDFDDLDHERFMREALDEAKQALQFFDRDSSLGYNRSVYAQTGECTIQRHLSAIETSKRRKKRSL
jgi:hypothetical protein